MPAAPARLAVLTTAGILALGATTATGTAAADTVPGPTDPAPAIGLLDAPERADSPTTGLPRPHGPRRVLDMKLAVAAFPTPACEHTVFLFFERGPVALADFGGGERIDGVAAVRTLRTAGFSWADMQTALSVMAAESDRCPGATHNNLTESGEITSTDYGLWQINTKWHPKYAGWNLFDPVTNTRAAKELHAASGWAPWHGYVNKDLFAGWAAESIARAQDAGVR